VRLFWLTEKGEDAVRRRLLTPPAPCPGDNQRPCLAMTRGGQRCRFCTRTVELEAIQAQYDDAMEATMPWGLIPDPPEPTAEALERMHRGVMERIAERRRDAG
jgi:hypothetical protein